MNQNNELKFFRIIGILSFGIAVLMGTFLALAIGLDFDNSIGHFAVNSSFLYLFVGCSAFGILFGIFSAISAKKKEYSLTSPLQGGVEAWIFSFAAAFCALILFFTNIGAYINGNAASLPAIGVIVFLPGVAAFFILSLFPSLCGGIYHGIAGIAACLFVNCSLFKIYFDFTLPLNSPIRNALVVMEAAFLASLLLQTRCIFKKIGAPVFSFIRCITISLTGGISFGLVLAALIFPAKLPAGVSVLHCALCLFSSIVFGLRYFIPEKNETQNESV